MNEIEALIAERDALRDELNRLKTAIKTCQPTTIIDGNDFYDYGWRSNEDINKGIRAGFYDQQVDEARRVREKIT